MKFVREYILQIFLVYSFILKSTVPQQDKKQYIIIDHDLVKVMDATRKVDMLKLLKLERDINQLLNGHQGKGLVGCHNEKYTVNMLTELEERSQRLDLRKSLAEALDLVRAITKDHMRETRAYKASMVTLITQWARQRKKPTTVLLEWGHQPFGKEHDQLKQLIHSFGDLKLFLDDLSLFLSDLRWSCKETWEEFTKKVLHHAHQ